MDTLHKEPAMPEQISSYRVEGEIARGGMGVVYRGVHMVFEEEVAIKAIFPELMLNGDLRDRFLNEARIQRRLQHRNIVQIREFLAENDRFYIVMEFIRGETLSQRLKLLGRPLTAEEALDIFGQTLEGLGYAHRQGVVHRDIKPSNIMLTAEGVAKVTDFGIARGVGSAKLTRTGMAVGTASYMSPEQVLGTPLDHRTDIYSLGVTLYEMMTGQVPFQRPKESDSDFPILTAHTSQPPPSPRQLVPGIPETIEAAILKALAKKPEDRFQTCIEFQRALGVRPAPGEDLVAALSASRPEAAGEAQVGTKAFSAQGPAAVAAVSTPPAGMAQARIARHQSQPHATPTPTPRPAPVVDPLKPRSARIAPKPEPAKKWVWAVVAVVLLAALAGGAWWWFVGRLTLFKPYVVLRGHTDDVTSVAFSPRDRRLATGSADRSIKLWDSPSWKLVRTLTGHSSYVEAVNFSPDGNLLASGSADGTIKIWDVATGNVVQTLTPNGKAVLSVAFGPRALHLASGNWDGSVRIWDVNTWALEKTLTGHHGPVNSVRYSPDGQSLATASDDGTIKLWNPETGEVIRTLTGHTDKVTSIAFSGDGRLLASGSGDATVRIWDVASGATLQTLRGHKLWVRAVAFSTDGRLVASGSDDNSIIIWDVQKGKPIQQLTGHTQDVDGLAFSFDNQWIASASADQTVQIWLRNY